MTVDNLGYNFGAPFQDYARMMSQGYKDAAELRMRDQIRQDAYDQNQVENKRNQLLASRYGTPGVDASGNPVLYNSFNARTIHQLMNGGAQRPAVDLTDPATVQRLQQLQQMIPQDRIITSPGRGFDEYSMASQDQGRSPAGVHENGFNYEPLAEEGLDKLNSPNLGEIPGPLAPAIMDAAGVSRPGVDSSLAYMSPAQAGALGKAVAARAPKAPVNPDEIDDSVKAFVSQMGGKITGDGQIQIPAHAADTLMRFARPATAQNPLTDLMTAEFLKNALKPPGTRVIRGSGGKAGPSDSDRRMKALDLSLRTLKDDKATLSRGLGGIMPETVGKVMLIDQKMAAIEQERAALSSGATSKSVPSWTSRFPDTSATPAPANGKAPTQKLYNSKLNQTKIIYSDGSQEIVDGKQ